MALSAARISIGGAVPRAETANSGVSAISGMATRSWNSSTAKAMRPWRSASSPFSSSTCRAKAVDDSDSARPANTAAGQARPKAMAMAAEQQRGDGDLGAAEAEDGGAHGPQPLGAQLQADQEQQQHHAELGKVQDRAHLVDGIDEAEPERADQHADQQVAQHVADAQQLGQRRRHHGSRQEQRHLRQGHVGHGSIRQGRRRSGLLIGRMAGIRNGKCVGRPASCRKGGGCSRHRGEKARRADAAARLRQGSREEERRRARPPPPAQDEYLMVQP